MCFLLEIPRGRSQSTNLEAQGVLRILLPCTRSILRRITNAGSGIGDSATRPLGCISDCVRHAFGGVSEGIADSSNCTTVSAADWEGKSSGMEEEGDWLTSIASGVTGLWIRSQSCLCEGVIASHGNISRKWAFFSRHVSGLET